MKKAIIIILFLFWTTNSVFAQSREDNHPELKWFTIETEHFEIHFHNGSERTAKVVAKVAEDVYGPITNLYQWKPDGKIHFIIKDHDDNSNGAAYYYDNKVEIWAPQMTFILRGTHNWLRNVVTHEFSHMISLGASRKITRRIPALYFQVIGYEDEKRPDVLYGYPNVITSYPIAMTVVPMWLAEGMAQYQVSGLDYDRWDSHRDMLIRTAVLANQLPSFDAMGVFGKNSLGNERTYNAGYALTRYIAKNYGQESLRKIAHSLRKPYRLTINGAFKDALGLDSNELYSKWLSELKSYYSSCLEKIKRQQVEGEIIVKKGLANVFPVWSPKADTIAFIGSQKSDYLSQTSLSIYDLNTGKTKILKGGVDTPISWSPDGSQIIYGRKRRERNGSHYYDLHIYNIDHKKETRLTHGLRSHSPAWSADGKRIVCIVQSDGTDNLLLLDSSGKNMQKVTSFENGEGIHTPHWSPNGKWIVFAKNRRHGRDIVLLDVATKKMRTLIGNIGDARDPKFSYDGGHVYFSWDRDGIANIYSVNLDGTNIQQWTNVVGGAFMPSLSPSGELVFSNFQVDGYKIARIEHPQPIDSRQEMFVEDAQAIRLGLGNGFDKNVDKKIKSAYAYDDSQLPNFNETPYEREYGSLTFLPRVMIDYGTIKLGSYFYSSDVLDRYSVIGGISLNKHLDLDAFGIFEYKRWAPTLFVELYGFTRNIDERIEVFEDYPEKTDVKIHFNLLEADIGAYYRLSDAQIIRAHYAHSRYTSKIRDFFFEGLKWVSPSNTYFIGNQFQLTWNLDAVTPRLDSRINPSIGRRVKIQYSREFNKFFSDFSTDNPYYTPVEIYNNYNYDRIEIDWHEYFPLPLQRHSLTFGFKGGYINKTIDGFFNFFAGGMPGLKGYPYYSIEGRKLLSGNLTYRFPIFTKKQFSFANLTFDKLYGGLFFDFGDAFDWNRLRPIKPKKDVGIALRLSLFSFYSFPTALFFNAAYGLDKINVSHEFGAGEINRFEYGEEWRFYFGVLFDFID